MIMLTMAQARAYLVKLHFEYGEKTVLAQTRRLQALQFDPLNVVGNNPDLVLQSRVPNYRPEMLRRELYERRTLVDGFDKMLCVFPIEDFPYLSRLRKTTVWWYRENEVVRAACPGIIEEIRRRGPVCSDDLPLTEKVNWPWGKTTLARAGLESLWMDGTLTLHHKEGVRRYYDLSDTLLPAEILRAPDPNDTEEKYFMWQTLRRIKSVGLLKNTASSAFLGVEDFKAPEREAAFQTLMDHGQLLSATIEGMKTPVYIPSEYEDALKDALENGVQNRARVLAPLDNLLWDRKLISEIFAFEYSWEVYVPKEKRKYGYYVLPVLLGDRFVARFEPKHFRGGNLSILNWWWEASVKPTTAMRRAVEAGLNRFCRYLGADGFTIERGWEN